MNMVIFLFYALLRCLVKNILLVILKFSKFEALGTLSIKFFKKMSAINIGQI